MHVGGINRLDVVSAVAVCRCVRMSAVVVKGGSTCLLAGIFLARKYPLTFVLAQKQLRIKNHSGCEFGSNVQTDGPDKKAAIPQV